MEKTLTHLKRQVMGQKGMIAVIVGWIYLVSGSRFLSASLTVVAGRAFRLKLLGIEGNIKANGVFNHPKPSICPKEK